MAWHDIAWPTGSPDQGFLGMHINFALPESTSLEPASSRQIESVRLFFETDFGLITRDQAHILLSCREFARLAIESLFKSYQQAVKEQFAKGVAAFLLTDADLRRFVVKWSESAFARGSASPRVRGAPIFRDVADFAEYLDWMVLLNGWTKDQLRSDKYV